MNCWSQKFTHWVLLVSKVWNEQYWFLKFQNWVLLVPPSNSVNLFTYMANEEMTWHNLTNPYYLSTTKQKRKKKKNPYNQQPSQPRRCSNELHPSLALVSNAAHNSSILTSHSTIPVPQLLCLLTSYKFNSTFSLSFKV